MTGPAVAMATEPEASNHWTEVAAPIIMNRAHGVTVTVVARDLASSCYSDRSATPGASRSSTAGWDAPADWRPGVQADSSAATCGDDGRRIAAQFQRDGDEVSLAAFITARPTTVLPVKTDRMRRTAGQRLF